MRSTVLRPNFGKASLNFCQNFFLFGKLSFPGMIGPIELAPIHLSLTSLSDDQCSAYKILKSCLESVV